MISSFWKHCFTFLGYLRHSVSAEWRGAFVSWTAENKKYPQLGKGVPNEQQN